MKFNRISEAFSWLESLYPMSCIRLGTQDVMSVAERLNLLPDPEQTKILTVAGSNGKGSICEMLSQILSLHGVLVGLYTSPHIVRFNERVKLSGVAIDDATLLESLNYIYQNLENSDHLTYFELTTLCSLWIFKQAKCQVIILEVGLGGRLDATNIVENDCAIISSISLEHTEYLGDTVEKIAVEKMGIVRKEKPVVLSDQLPAICFSLAEKKRTKTYCLNHDFRLKTREGGYDLTLPDDLVTNQQNSLKLRALPEHIVGEHQKDNLSMAIIGLLSIGIILNDRDINTAIDQLYLPARLQTFSSNGLVGWLDTAHNPAAVSRVATFLESVGDFEIVAIFSCLSDKKPAEMIRQIKHKILHWHIIQLEGDRAMPIKQIQASLQEERVPSEAIFLYEEAHDFLEKIATYYEQEQKNLAIKCLVFGSFVLLNKMQKHVNF